MKKIQLLVAGLALILAVSTTAFTKVMKSSKFVNYYSSALLNPTAGQFDSNFTQSDVVIKNSLCPGADNRFCRNAWLPAHVVLNGSGQPTAIALDGSGNPYPPDKIILKP